MLQKKLEKDIGSVGPSEKSRGWDESWEGLLGELRGRRSGGREPTGGQTGGKETKEVGRRCPGCLGSWSQSQRSPRFPGAGQALAFLPPTLVMGWPLLMCTLGCGASSRDPWSSAFPVVGVWMLIFMASTDVTRRSQRKACRWPGSILCSVPQPSEKAGPPVQAGQPPQSLSAVGILSSKRSQGFPCCPQSLNLTPDELQIYESQSTGFLLVHPHGHPACI